MSGIAAKFWESMDEDTDCAGRSHVYCTDTGKNRHYNRLDSKVYAIVARHHFQAISTMVPWSPAMSAVQVKFAITSLAISCHIPPLPEAGDLPSQLPLSPQSGWGAAAWAGSSAAEWLFGLVTEHLCCCCLGWSLGNWAATAGIGSCSVPHSLVPVQAPL